MAAKKKNTTKKNKTTTKNKYDEAYRVFARALVDGRTKQVALAHPVVGRAIAESW